MSVNTLRVLSIAPEVKELGKLAWAQEIGGLAQIAGVELQIVAGPAVTESMVAQTLREPHDVVIWSGHGAENELILPGNRKIRGRWLATQAKKGEPRVMLLAACSSAMADDRNDSLTWLVSRAGLNVVGFPPALPDDAAITYVTEFVRSLVAGCDVGEAHDVAIEAICDGWPEVAKSIRFHGGITNGYRFIIETIRGQGERLDRLERGQEEILTILRGIVK